MLYTIKLTEKPTSFKSFLSNIEGSLDLNIKKCKEVNDPQLIEELVGFERSHIKNKFKMGILYARDGQTTEKEMFSNGIAFKNH